MKRVVKVLMEAEAALKEGFENCGEDPECLWAEPLQKVRDEIKRLVAAAPDVAVAADEVERHAARPDADRRRIAAVLREL